MLRVHRGFFLSMGVGGWHRFVEVITLLHRNPEFVREAMAVQGRLRPGWRNGCSARFKWMRRCSLSQSPVATGL